MRTASGRQRRPQTLGEEIANSVSHGIGAVAALASLPILVAGALRHGTSAIVGAAVFAGTAFLLYLVSTLYHALPPGRAKRVFRVLDHSAIFLLIAGTYTPFTLGVLGGAWGWTLFGIVWTLAALGIVSKSLAGIRFPVLSTVLYVAMGWLVVVAIRPLWLRMPGPGIAWLVAGGLAYTAGVAFYAAPRLKYAHFVFHLFVVAGTVCHGIAVYFYAA